MTSDFWFNRMVEYWSIPPRLDLVNLVKQSRIQVVQTGTFGPQFYSLADDPDVDRHWVGMPQVGVRENLTYVKDLIDGVHEAGALFIGQMSLAWHYGDHEARKGLFGAWDTIWEEDLLGSKPFDDPVQAQETIPDGNVRRWPIEGRPYQAYSGCLSNPKWITMLKRMIKKAIDTGVDGLMVHHNFTKYCSCVHCLAELRGRYRENFDDADLRNLFGTRNLSDLDNLFTFQNSCPDKLREKAVFAEMRWECLRRKEVFDDLFVSFGRSIKPNLKVAQWYHKYDFTSEDERSLLPDELWARDEDYIWYSQGGEKGISRIEHGYISDMGLPSRFVHAAGNGRPFVINKYDYRRFRLSVAEASANHAAGPAFHWSQQGNETYIIEEYTGVIKRYHRFLERYQHLIHPAEPWSQAAIVYPRRAEVAGERDALGPLRRIGRLLEDRHYPFEIIIDTQITDAIGRFDLLVLAGVRRISRDEEAIIEAYVSQGGKVILTSGSGLTDIPGNPYETPLFASWRATPDAGVYGRIITHKSGSVLYVPDVPWSPISQKIEPGVDLPLYPLPDRDEFGIAFHTDLDSLLDDHFIITDAPWYIRMRAWRPSQSNAIVLHWVNYHQNEDSEIEVPIPSGSFQVDVKLQQGQSIDRIDWLYPEMPSPGILAYELHEGFARIQTPGVIVYGLSVIHLKSGK